MIKNKQRKIEILAPAKDLKSGIAAINCGADSVYIAADKFGLRKRCNNTLDDIRLLIEYAHKYWVKVYVVVNSLIYRDDVLEEVRQLIQKLYEMKVDAVIITDMGILTLDLPPIPIFASVNTRCFTAEKINFLSDIGIKRVILPRELTFEEVKEISSKSKIPLELFCHGTFCVAISGNCYLKFAQNINNTNASKDLLHYQKNSSNNGACIASCSGCYNLIDEDGNYVIKNEKLLNLRYLNLLDELPNLIDAGIDSFKIEGRQREISYIKNIVALFSQKANEVIKNNSLIERASSGSCVLGFEPSLDKTFNRGFTNYFMHGRKKEMLSKNDLYGNYIGAAHDSYDNTFLLESDLKLKVGDRLLYKDNMGEVRQIDIINVSEDKNRYTYLGEDNNISGFLLYRIVNSASIEEIENAKSYRVISTSIKFEKAGESEYSISIEDEDDIFVSVKFKVNQGNNISKDEILSLFQQNIDSEFFVENILSEGTISLSLKDVSEIKNILFNKLRLKRQSSRPFEVSHINNHISKYPQDITYLDNVTNSNAIEFYKKHGVSSVELGLENDIHIKGKKICTGKYCLKYELGLCKDDKKPKQNTKKWFIEDIYGNKYRLDFDCKKCEMSIIG